MAAARAASLMHDGKQGQAKEQCPRLLERRCHVLTRSVGVFLSWTKIRALIRVGLQLTF